MKKILFLVFALANTVVYAQSKKQQIIILNDEIITLNNRVDSFRLALSNEIKLSNENSLKLNNRVDSFRLALSSERQSKLSNEKRDALKINNLKIEIENKKLNIDSLGQIIVNFVKGVSNTESDFNIKEYLKLDSLCLEYSKYKIEVFLTKENNNEEGAVMRFHKNGKVAKISVGASACGDCGSFYCVYFNNKGKLIREELSQWCAVEGESEPTYGKTIISYLNSEFGNSFPNKVVSNFNAEYIDDFVKNYREFKDGKIHCCWLRTTEQETQDNMAFDCLNF